MTCWWSLYREWYFRLSTLSTAAPWDPPKGHKHRIYASDDFEFHESEIEGHFDELEEQLWAFRNGLSDLVFTIEISLPQRKSSPPKGRKPVKGAGIVRRKALSNLRKLMRS